MSQLVGCHIWGLVPDLRTPVDHAREIEPKCVGFSAASAAAFLAPSAIDSVEPAYSYVKAGPNDPEARLRGARIHVAPRPGFSRESLARTLECHEARVTLGKEVAPADDPYVLPTGWVDIDVDSERDGFAVNARADEFDDARQVLARARQFVGMPAR